MVNTDPDRGIASNTSETRVKSPISEEQHASHGLGTLSNPKPTEKSRAEVDREVSLDNVEEGAAEPEPDERYPYLAGFRLWNLMAALMLGMLLLGLDINIVATAIPTISDQFHSIADVNWYGSAFLLALCAMQPLAGKLYTCFSTKPTYLGFMVVFEIGSLVCALAQSSHQVIAGRAVSGVGGSGLINGALVILTAASPPKIRPMVTACGISMIAIGGIVGPLVGGALTQHVSWRWCFYVFLPPGCVTIFITAVLHIPEQTKKPPVKETLPKLPMKLDIIGFLLFAPACILFLIAISWGGTNYPWNSANVIGLLCGSAGIIGLFCAWCIYRGDEALLPPSLLRGRTLFFGCWISALQGGATIMMGYYLPLWFQSIKGASPTNSGLMMLPTMISQILGSGMSGALVRRWHYVPPWAIFGSMITAIGSGLMTTFVEDTSEGKWIGYQIMAGFGRGAALNMPVVAAQEVLTAEVFALASASIALAQYLGGSVAISIGNTIFQNGLAPALAKYAPTVDAHTIINAGATGLAGSVSAEQLPGVLLAYNEALVKVFYVPTATAAAAFLLSFGFRWDKIGMDDKKKKEKMEENNSVDRQEPEESAEAQDGTVSTGTKERTM